MRELWNDPQKRSLLLAAVWTVAAAACAVSFLTGLGRLDLHFFASMLLLIGSVICAVSWWRIYLYCNRKRNDSKINQEEKK